MMNTFFQVISFTTPIAFALTYLLHSTIWILIVAMLLKLPLLQTPKWRNYLWKAALVGALCTSLSTSVQVEKTWVIPIPTETEIVPLAAATTIEECYMVVEESALPTSHYSIRPNVELIGDLKNETEKSVVSTPLVNTFQQGSGFMGLVENAIPYLLLTWILISIILLIHLCIQHHVFFHKIITRESIDTSPSLLNLESLKSNAGLADKPILLSHSSQLDSPILIRNSEICLPTKAVVELDQKQLTAMLAHELAHVARYDYYWTCFMAIMQIIFFFQPLNRWAIKEIKQSNELLCDSWAARVTGNHIAVAQCLITVAEWIKDRPNNQYALVAGMALKKTELCCRVESLLKSPTSRQPSFSFTKASLLVSLLLICSIWILPSFSLKQTLPLQASADYTEKLNILNKQHQEKNKKECVPLTSPFLADLQIETPTVLPPSPSIEAKKTPIVPVRNNASTLVKESPKPKKVDLNHVQTLSSKKQCGLLLEAINENRIGHVQQLLSIINPNCLNCKSVGASAPLNAAARNGTVQIGKLLLDAGAHIYFKARQDEGALLGAVQNAQYGFVQLLLDHGAYIDAEIIGHGTPLVNAIKQGNYEMTKFLLERGADATIAAETGETPMELANFKGRKMLDLVAQYQN